MQLGHLDRRFVAFAAGIDEQRLRERLGDDLRERLGKLHDAARDHAGEQMQRGVAALFDGGDDVRMVVADGGAHLARREVEDLPALRVEDVAALRLLDDLVVGVAAVADQVGAKIAARLPAAGRFTLCLHACAGRFTLCLHACPGRFTFCHHVSSRAASPAASDPASLSSTSRMQGG